MSLDRVHHVTITVANIETAVNWYQSSFNCELIQYEPTFAVLQFENVRLDLALPSQERPHIAYLHAEAGKLGEIKPMRDGSKGTYISDPTGNIVEVVESESDSK